MKLTLVLFILSSFSWAGTPDQDLIVDIMRERFKESSEVISEDDLAIDQSWLCVYYNARKGIVTNFTSYKKLFRFEKESFDSYINKESFGVKNFKLSNTGSFVGTNGDDRLFARKAKDQTLIFEHAASQYKVGKSYVSVSDSKLSGHGYIYCKVEVDNKND